MRAKKDAHINELLSYVEILPDFSKEVLELYHIQGKTLEEICAITRKSMFIVSNQYHRGIFLLRKHKAELDQSSL